VFKCARCTQPDAILDDKVPVFVVLVQIRSSRPTCRNFAPTSLHLESASFSPEPRGRNPNVLRVFRGDHEFRHGTEIRGIREKIDQRLVKWVVLTSFARNSGYQKVTDNKELGTLELASINLPDLD
jgi:hypothetical protein